MTETNVLQLSQPGTFTDPLTEVLRNGARVLLAQAVQSMSAGKVRNTANAQTSGSPALRIPSRMCSTSLGSL